MATVPMTSTTERNKHEPRSIVGFHLGASLCWVCQLLVSDEQMLAHRRAHARSGEYPAVTLFDWAEQQGRQQERQPMKWK